MKCLPAAVCRDIGLGKLRGVAIAPTIPGCPPKSAQMPLCRAPDTCVSSDDICPRDLPPAWIGFTCWGQARFESFDRTRVFAAYFGVNGKGPEKESPSFEFCISQIHFIREENQ